MHEHLVFTDGDFSNDALEADHDDATVVEHFEFDGLHAAHIEAPADAADVFDAHDWVTGVYDNFEAHLHLAPEAATTDDTNQVATLDRVSQLQEIPPDGSGVGTGDDLSIVVMDSGRDQDQFDNPIEQIDVTGTGDDTDDVGHGTATLGLVSSLAPNADRRMLRIFGSGESTSGNIILRGYQWLIQHADEIDLVNMSWGGNQDIPEIDQLHETLLSKGVLAVVSAGNSGGASGSPAVAKNAFSVGAVDLDGDLTSFSSYNPEQNNPDTCAVGLNNLLRRSKDGSMGTPVSVGDDRMIHKDQKGDYVVASGTSFSAPIQTGMAAMLLSTSGVRTSVMELPSLFEKTSKDIPDTNNDGNGIALLREALGEVLDDPDPTKPTEPTEPTDPSPFEQLDDFLRQIVREANHATRILAALSPSSTPESLDATVPGQVEFFEGKDGQYYWHARAENGDIVADGSQGYASKEKAVEGAHAALGILSSGVAKDLVE